MGKKKNYESPYIKRSQVETESSFCAASIIEEDTKGVKSQGHETGTDVTFGQGGYNEWTEDSWTSN